MLTTTGASLPQRLVLYIEDNLANIALVEELLSRREDLKLLSSRTGTEGLELAIARRPDVILMDIHLPDISGLDALKCLHFNTETADIPVMALSSNAYPKQIQQGLEAGFFRYLTKPFRFTEFTDALDACLDFAAKKPGLGSRHPQVGAAAESPLM